MPLKIQNYEQWEGDRPGGHHPPNCTCFRCNEVKLGQRRAQEEQRRAAEYDRRMALVGKRSPARSRRALGPSKDKTRAALFWFFLVAATGAAAAGIVYVISLA